jgi:hypothetical protein
MKSTFNAFPEHVSCVLLGPQQAAVRHHSTMFLGQLAASLASAAEHVFVPDIALNRLELGATVLVSMKTRSHNSVGEHHGAHCNAGELDM